MLLNLCLRNLCSILIDALLLPQCPLYYPQKSLCLIRSIRIDDRLLNGHSRCNGQNSLRAAHVRERSAATEACSRV